MLSLKLTQNTNTGKWWSYKTSGRKNGEHFYNLGTDKHFFNRKQNPQTIKEKNRNIEPTKNFKFLLLKKIPLKIKWRKYLEYMLQDVKEYKKNS